MGTRGGPRRPQPTRARLGGLGWRTQVGCAHLVAPLWWLLAPVFLTYSKIILRKILAHLEMCIIGISNIAFSGPEFQLSAFSLLV